MKNEGEMVIVISEGNQGGVKLVMAKFRWSYLKGNVGFG